MKPRDCLVGVFNFPANDNSAPPCYQRRARPYIYTRAAIESSEHPQVYLEREVISFGIGEATSCHNGAG